MAAREIVRGADVLRCVESCLVDERGMLTRRENRRSVDDAGGGKRSVCIHAGDGGALAPDDEAGINGVFTDAHHGAICPEVIGVGAQAEGVEPLGDGRAADFLVGIHIENHADDGRLIWIRLKRIAFAGANLDFSIAVGNAPLPKPLGSGSLTAALHTSLDVFILAARHHQIGLKYVFIPVLGEVVGVFGRDDLCAGILERVHDAPLIH